MHGKLVRNRIINYIEGRPYELIIYQKENTINDTMTVQIADLPVSTKDLPIRDLKSQQLLGNYNIGELFVNFNNIFPYLLLLSKNKKIVKTINYKINQKDFKLYSPKAKEDPVVINKYSNSAYTIFVNYYE